MCKFNFLIISILFLLCACGQSQNVDWKELCESADMEAHKYCRHKSDTHFDKAIQLYDTVIKNSPEYRNKALIGKMELLTNASKYEEAVQIIADMSDTASVFSPVLTKTMLINNIMRRKAFMECDGANMRVYTKKNGKCFSCSISAITLRLTFSSLAKPVWLSLNSSRSSLISFPKLCSSVS